MAKSITFTNYSKEDIEELVDKKLKSYLHFLTEKMDKMHEQIIDLQQLNANLFEAKNIGRRFKNGRTNN
jgi:hypothetical protein